MWLSRLRTQHSVCEDAGLTPGFTQWIGDLALLQVCSTSHRGGSNPVSPWLWCRPAAPIQPLAWGLPYAASAAIKRKKKKILNILGERMAVGKMGCFSIRPKFD